LQSLTDTDLHGPTWGIYCVIVGLTMDPYLILIQYKTSITLIHKVNISNAVTATYHRWFNADMFSHMLDDYDE
jgi:hypothetical protein